MPGPACYGRGGERADAHRRQSRSRLPRCRLLPRRTHARSIATPPSARSIALGRTPLGLDLTRAAWGIHEVINEDVARAFRVHASERAFDYGSAAWSRSAARGPMHAARIARKLRVPARDLPDGRRRDVGARVAAPARCRSRSCAPAACPRRGVDDVVVDGIVRANRARRDPAPRSRRVLRRDVVAAAALDMRYEGRATRSRWCFRR